jgi:signal transduction histidine kinase
MNVSYVPLLLSALCIPSLLENLRVEPRPPINTTETLQLAAETAGVGTWDLAVLDDELHSSPRCKEIFGFAATAAFQYDDFLNCIYPMDREVVHAVVQRALSPEGTGEYENEYRVVLPGGAVRWIFAKGRVFFENHGNQPVAIRMIGTVLDRTDQKRAQEALIEAERLAITGRLAASIAHEIRNPLDTVTNLLYLVESEKTEGVRSQYLSQAREELGRISQIASSTLGFYRDPVGRTSFDIAELLQSVLVLFQGRFSVQQVKIETDLPYGVFVEAPQGEVRQVSVNLIANALDAMPRGGRIIVRIRKFYDHHAQRPCVRLTIADTGHGMSPEVLKRIFDAFYTTKGESGNGLGLWLSLEIMKKCESTMLVKSSRGRGTVFQVCLVGSNNPADSLK